MGHIGGGEWGNASKPARSDLDKHMIYSPKLVGQNSHTNFHWLKQRDWLALQYHEPLENAGFLLGRIEIERLTS
jgi:hypothetical protein